MGWYSRRSNLLAALVGASAALIVVVYSAWSPTETFTWTASGVQADTWPLGEPAGGLAPGQGIVLKTAEGATQCTLGAIWVSEKGEKLGLTARHCAGGDASVHTYRSLDESAIGHFMRNPTEVDAALMWLETGVTPDPYLKTRTARIPIVSYGAAEDGEKVCTLGANSETVCGYTVTQQVGQHQLEDGSFVPTAAVDGRSGPCTLPGDSGGPVFALGKEGARLLGIVTAVSTRNGLGPLWPPGCTVAFTTVEQITAQFGGHPLLAEQAPNRAPNR